MSDAGPDLRSTITCPQCGHRETETMPTDACQFFYDCKGCGAVLRPEPGGCCVFCSYGTTPCPRSGERRVGKECGSTCRSRGDADYLKKNDTIYYFDYNDSNKQTHKPINH